MPRLFVPALFVLLLLIVTSTAAQTSPPPPVAPQPSRDSQAVAAVQSAINALGGPAVIGSIKDATFKGTLQSATADATSAQSGNTTFTWMVSGAEFREEVSSPSTYRIYVSNSGSPIDNRDGQNVSVPDFVARVNLPYELPGLVLLNELNNPNYTISSVATTTLNGKTVIHIHTCDETDYTSHLILGQDWYFDSSTALPVRVEYKLPDAFDVQHPLALSIDFSNFTVANGILVPYTLNMTAGPISSVATVNSVVLNSGLPASTFTSPTGSVQ